MFWLSILASRSLVRAGGTPDAFNCIISLCNSRTNGWSYVLDSWDSKFVRFLDVELKLCSVIIVHVAIQVVFLLLFVEVDQFRVQRLIERFQILQTALDIAGFPEPIRSSADVVQRVPFFCCCETSSACGA